MYLITERSGKHHCVYKEGPLKEPWWYSQTVSITLKSSVVTWDLVWVHISLQVVYNLFIGFSKGVALWCYILRHQSAPKLAVLHLVIHRDRILIMQTFFHENQAKNIQKFLFFSCCETEKYYLFDKSHLNQFSGLDMKA